MAEAEAVTNKAEGARPRGAVRVVTFRDGQHEAWDQAFDLDPRKGTNVALVFPGFCVLVTTDGAVLVPTKAVLECFRKMPEGKDRVLLSFNEATAIPEEAFKRLVAVSHEIWPKDAVK